MTAQAMERLNYDGMWRALATLPLEAYLYSSCCARPKGVRTTAHRRRYVGYWEIRGNRLYLVGLDLNYSPPSKDINEDSLKRGLRTVFPETDEVFAEWFTGVLRCPEGELVTSIRLGFGSTYEWDRLIEVKEGVVQGVQVKKGMPGSLQRDLGTTPDKLGLRSILNAARRIMTCLSRFVRTMRRNG